MDESLLDESLLDVLVHLFLTALLAASLCIASIVAAGGLALVFWIVMRIGRGIVSLVRARRAPEHGKTRGVTVPLTPHRLRRP